MSKHKDYLIGGVFAAVVSLLLMLVVAFVMAPHPSDGSIFYALLGAVALISLGHGYAEYRRSLEEEQYAATEPDAAKQKVLVILGSINLLVAGTAISVVDHYREGLWNAMDSNERWHWAIQAAAVIGLIVTLAQLVAVLKLGWTSLHRSIGLFGTALALASYAVLAILSVPVLRSWVGL